MKMYDSGALIKVKISSITHLHYTQESFTAARVRIVQKSADAPTHEVAQA